jgi:hypothetical protein
MAARAAVGGSGGHLYVIIFKKFARFSPFSQPVSIC